MRKKFDPATRVRLVKLGGDLRSTRLGRGWSQVQVASVLGITQKSVSDLELGNSGYNYEKVADYLAGRTDYPDPPSDALEDLRPLVEAADAAEAAYRAEVAAGGSTPRSEVLGDVWQASRDALAEACVGFVRRRLAL